MLPELYTVNKAATWNESYRSYLGRSHRRKVGKKSEIRSKACCEKSAEVIVKGNLEGPNETLLSSYINCIQFP